MADNEQLTQLPEYGYERGMSAYVGGDNHPGYEAGMSAYVSSSDDLGYEAGMSEYVSSQRRGAGGGFRTLAIMALVGIGGYKLLGMDSSTPMPKEAMPEFVTPDTIIPEIASPEVAAVNIALAEVKLGQENNLDALVEAIKGLDAAFAPTDKDRMANMPAGYVKMLLPHEAVGIMVPYTVAERTADVERYTSPEMAAALYANAKLYQDIVATHPELEVGVDMLRIRDENGPDHLTHNTGTQADISGAYGMGVTQYSNGAFADQLFSDRFNRQFTIEMAVGMAGFRVAGEPVISSLLYSDTDLNNEVNQLVGRNFMQYKADHNDHMHITLIKKYIREMWRPHAPDLPWNGAQDLHIGGMAVPISPEQHASQHGDFEAWMGGRMRYAEQLLAQNKLKAPEGFETEALTPEAENYIAAMAIPDERKDFLRQMVPSIATVYRAGAHINPVVALTQTSLETGFGQSQLNLNANNYFGMKAGSKWVGDVYNAKTKEEYKAGTTVTITDDFRAYPDSTSSVADYARLITNAKQYSDAVQNYASITGYTNGLFNEVDAQGNIIQEQGAPGVLSYGTDRDYEQKVFATIEQYGYESLLDAQLNGTRG